MNSETVQNPSVNFNVQKQNVQPFLDLRNVTSSFIVASSPQNVVVLTVVDPKVIHLWIKGFQSKITGHTLK